MLVASNRSSRMLGSGTSITKIKPTAATGMIHSAAEVLAGREEEAGSARVAFGAMSYVLGGAAARRPRCELLFWLAARDSARQTAARISATTAYSLAGIAWPTSTAR